jgi:hypothetical protein
VCTGRFACNGVCSNVTCVTRKVGPC